MARKGWEALSPTYRKRLEKSGVSQQAYDSGSSLEKARGHVSAAQESFLSKRRRGINRFINEYSQTYGVDADDVREELGELSRTEVDQHIQLQKDMQDLYDTGQQPAAHALWAARNSSLPDWMNMYHGIFS